MPAIQLLLGLLPACGITSSDGPSTITLSRTAFTLDAIGATEDLGVVVKNTDGDILSGEPVEWTSSNETVATVSPTGVVTAWRNGTARITATSGRASGSADVTVEQIATSIEKLSGDDQSGAAGEPLPAVLVVRAMDRLGNSVANVPVEFEILDGGGSATPSQVQTGADGRASSTWTLGSVAHEEQSLRVFLAFRVGAGVTFEATAGPGAPNEVVVVEGDDQAAPRLTTLLRPLVVRVEDRVGNPVVGVPVQFTVVEGGGSVQPGSAITDEDGRAATAWTLGGLVGTQTVSVTSPGLTAITISANATLAPEALQIVAGNGQTGVVGEPVAEPPAVRVLGPGGAPLVGLDVEFEVSAGGGLLGAGTGALSPAVTIRTDGSGIAAVAAWILGPTPGPNALTVSVPGLPPVGFTADAEAGPPAALVKVSGDRQIGVVSTTLPVPLVVEVSDALGNRLEGVQVTFAPGAGSGSVNPAQENTASNGTAATAWTLGATEGPQSVVASIAGGLSVTFTATATGEDGFLGLQIQLQFIDQPTAPQLASFQAATSRWAGAIPGGLGPQPVQLAAGQCGGGDSPAVNTVVEDVLIFVRVRDILNDGIGGVLGQAAVCAVRASNGLPLVAHVLLDRPDVVRLQAGNRLVDLILHELGHALGFGTLWRAKDLLVNPSIPNNRGVDTHFRGTTAIQAFNAVGGAGYTGGQKVPVENVEGGGGTRDSHWRASVFKNELMTGFLTTGVNPLSRVTIASLGDLGYQVDQGAADPYQLTGVNAPPRVPETGPGGEPPLPFGDDVVPGPIYIVGEDGRIQGKLSGP